MRTYPSSICNARSSLQQAALPVTAGTLPFAVRLSIDPQNERQRCISDMARTAADGWLRRPSFRMLLRTYRDHGHQYSGSHLEQRTPKKTCRRFLRTCTYPAKHHVQFLKTPRSFLQNPEMNFANLSLSTSRRVIGLRPAQPGNAVMTFLQPVHYGIRKI